MPSNTVSNFSRGGDVIQLFVQIEEPSSMSLQSRDREQGTPFDLIALHPLFSHTTFRLIEMLSITQHGAYETRSKQGNYQTILELGGHIGERYLLNASELQGVQNLHQQILETQVRRWRLYKKLLES